MAEDMHVILGNVPFGYLHIMGQTDLDQQDVQTLAHRSRKDRAAALGRPHQMVLAVVNRVRGVTKRHASIIPIPLRLGANATPAGSLDVSMSHSILTPAHNPPPQAAGHLSL